MKLDVVFLQVLILLVIVVVGFISGKIKIISTDTNKKLTDILLYITAPMLIIMSFQREFSKEILFNGGKVVIIAICIHVISALIAIIFFKKVNKKTANVMNISVVFSNCAFMGFPIIDSVFGKDGILYASFYVAVFNLFIWTYAVTVLTGKKDLKSLKNAVLTSGFISVVIGIIMFVLKIKLPEFIAKPFDMLGSITTPLAMIIVGVLMAESDLLKIIKNKFIYIAAFFKLLLIPGLTYIVLYLIGVRGLVLSISVLLAAMPTAVNVALFAEKYDGDAKLASGIVGITTIFSILTLSGFLYLVTR